MNAILLVDMDYFYAACEEVRKPEIKGKPVVVGADPRGKGRGVVLTCNYIARKYGIRSGMPISMAYRLKSDALYILPDFDYYEYVSKAVMDLLRKYATSFEQVSIDEAFVDVSGKAKSDDEVLALAEAIKKEINTRLKMPCSIGVSNSKLVAKMACEAAKPGGIRLVRQEEAKDFMSDMPVGKLYGIGRKTEEKLIAMGYKRVGDLAAANPATLRNAFGVFGIEMHNSANGIDESRVEENGEVKSISRETTFDKDTSDREEIVAMIKRLSDAVVQDVKGRGMSFKVVTLKIKYPDFTEHLKSKSLGHTSNSVADIVNTAVRLYDTYIDGGDGIRKVGIRVSTLIKSSGQRKIDEFTS